MEMVLVVFISSIVMFTAIPNMRKQALNTKIKQFSLDFNDLAQAITAHRTMYGYYPTDTTALNYLPKSLYLFLPQRFKKNKQSNSGINIAHTRPFNIVSNSAGWKYEYEASTSTAKLSAKGINDELLLNAGFESVKNLFAPYNCKKEGNQIIYLFNQDI